MLLFNKTYVNYKSTPLIFSSFLSEFQKRVFWQKKSESWNSNKNRKSHMPMPGAWSSGWIPKPGQANQYDSSYYRIYPTVLLSSVVHKPYDKINKLCFIFALDVFFLYLMSLSFLDYITYLCRIGITKKGFVTRQFDKWSKIPKNFTQIPLKNRQTAKLRFFLTNFDMKFYLTTGVPCLMHLHLYLIWKISRD